MSEAPVAPGRAERVIGAVAGVAASIAALTVLVALAVTSYGVLMRYVFGTPVTWVDELSGYLVIVIVMMGCASVLLRGEHIGVDLLSVHATGATARALAIWSMIAVALFSAALIYSGVLMLRYSVDFGIYSEGYLEAPMWMPQAVLFAGAILLGLAAVARIMSLLRAHRDAR
ncbi:MAG: TRAP transporter small permease [Burkholderiaceae bacterium]